MPVYGLPLSLEASLNSLSELRPPTSWRVSGHGDEVTVVLRWTLSGSPSSDKTLDYDMDHTATSIGPLNTSGLWTRGIKRTENLSPGMDIKTKSSSDHDCQLTGSHEPRYDSLQPFKSRKLDTVSHLEPGQPSPIPVYLSVADEAFQTYSLGNTSKPHLLVCENANAQPHPRVCDSIHTQPHPRVCDSIHTQPHPRVCDSIHTQPHPRVCDSIHTQPHQLACDVSHRQPYSLVCDSSYRQPHLLVCENAHTTPTNIGNLSPINQCRTNCDSKRESLVGEQDAHLSPSKYIAAGDAEIRKVVSTFLTPSSSHVSPEKASVTLDEKSGLFTNTQHFIHQELEVRVDGNNIDQSSLGDPTQNDSGCASESNSTSLSHYVKQTLSRDSSSPDGSLYKSASTLRSHRGSASVSKCSSGGSNISRSSCSQRSGRSKTNSESMDSSSDNCCSQDLDMVCSNEAERQESQADTVSNRSSISHWDSFDSFQSDLLAPEVSVTGEIINDCSSPDKSQHSHFTI